MRDKLKEPIPFLETMLGYYIALDGPTSPSWNFQYRKTKELIGIVESRESDQLMQWIKSIKVDADFYGPAFSMIWQFSRDYYDLLQEPVNQ